MDHVLIAANQNLIILGVKIAILKRFLKELVNGLVEIKFILFFIQDTQLKARKNHEVIEWISNNHLRNIQYFAQGGFSNTFYKAISNGYIKR